MCLKEEPRQQKEEETGLEQEQREVETARTKE